MATQSSILAWRIPWTEEPGGLQSRGSQRVGHAWSTWAHTCCLREFWSLWQGTPKARPRTHQCWPLTRRELVPYGDALDPFGMEPRVDAFSLSYPDDMETCFLFSQVIPCNQVAQEQGPVSTSAPLSSFFLSFLLFLSFSLAPLESPSQINYSHICLYLRLYCGVTQAREIAGWGWEGDGDRSSGRMSCM